MKPRVAAFTLGGVLAELRLAAPLNALYRMGKISAYTIIHGNGESQGPHDFREFDCVLVQRDCYPWLSQLLFDESLPYILDLDDLLVVRPNYSEFETAGDINALVEHAAHITCATDELRRKLSLYTGFNTESKSSVVPNAMLFPSCIESCRGKLSAIAWTSADFSSLTHSSKDIVKAISEFARESRLPVYLFGHFNSDHLKGLPNTKIFGSLDFWAHKMLLAGESGLLGIAPLETKADKVTLDFVNSKSDLKMVEYGGFGHAGVYSKALPYLESDLRTGVLVENNYDAWYDGLREAHQRAQESDFVNADEIREKRHIDRVALEYWQPAIESSLLPRPYRFEALAVQKHMPTSVSLEFERLVPDESRGSIKASLAPLRGSASLPEHITGNTTTRHDQAAELALFLFRPVLFTEPELIDESSAWIGHLPFGFWMVDAVQPRILVELGTHRGVSYCAFCQAIKALGIPCNAYAVDTWEGDEFTGHYGEEVFLTLATFHDCRYSGFSSLVRSSFDDALEHFGDQTIDLLHIDGCHTYDAVREDFFNWLPKMSDRGVVLLHDINVREGDFGVWKLWEELRSRYPSFSFMHSYGLGILAVGDRISEAVRWLTGTHDRYQPANSHIVREFFRRQAEPARYRCAEKFLVREIHARQLSLDEKALLATKLQNEVDEKALLATKLQNEVAELFVSTSWRVTAPLRALARLLRG